MLYAMYLLERIIFFLLTASLSRSDRRRAGCYLLIGPKTKSFSVESVGERLFFSSGFV
jgi:hypothetical protein